MDFKCVGDIVYFMVNKPTCFIILFYAEHQCTMFQD